MESQPQYSEYRNNPEKFHLCICCGYSKGPLGTQENCINEMVILSTQNIYLN